MIYVFMGWQRFLALFLVVFLIHFPAWAGSQRDEALAEVERGWSITSSGDLNRAMDILRGVEEKFPEENEAIAMARYRIAECLMAGLRWEEARLEAREAWRRVQDGEIEDPDFPIWAGYLYARCLDVTGDQWNLAEVAHTVADKIRARPEPDTNLTTAYGWLRFFSGRCFAEKDQFGWAFEAAGEAFDTGKRVSDGTLASAARHLQARAALEMGNVLLAHQILLECEAHFVPHESSDYRDLIRKSLSETRGRMGLKSQARNAIIEMLSDPSSDEGIVAHAVVSHANSAISQGATMEALSSLLVGYTLLPHVPHWGNRMALIIGETMDRIPEDAFEAALTALASEADHPLEEAAFRILLANRLADRGMPEEGARHCIAAAKAASQDARLKLPLELARIECGIQTGETQLYQVYENAIRSATGNRSRIEYLAARIKQELGRSVLTPSWRNWLETRQDILPRDFYLIEMAKILAWNTGDCEAALELVEEILAMDGVDRWEAHVEKISNLYMMYLSEEAEEAISAFETEISDPSRVEYGFFQASRRILNYRRTEAALGLLDRIIASGKDPTWLRDALLKKAKIQRMVGDIPAAIAILETLIALTPLVEECRGGMVGEGFTLLAWIFESDEYKDLDRAHALYETVILSPDTMPLAQKDAYHHYSLSLYREGRFEEVIDVCERGLANLPIQERRIRAMLLAIREASRYRLGLLSRVEMETIANEIRELDGYSASIIIRVLREEQ